MSLKDVKWAMSNSHLFNITINSHDQELFLSIHILFILCINTGNFFSVFSLLQDVITCTYMTCKNKVNKTPVAMFVFNLE